MGLDGYVVIGSAVVGLLVGLTGAGGGALMTPMLILLFSVKPSAAISSDLVAAVVMRPVGAAVHLHKGTVNLRLVGWMTLGSVPMAFFGAYLLRLLGNGSADSKHVEIALGAALLAGAAAMVVRFLLDRRSGQARTGQGAEGTIRPGPTVLIGMVGGLIVGLTSVGSGSLMIILLLFAYPMLSAGQLVGTDLTPAVPPHRGGRPRRAGLRARRVRGHRLHHRRQRARGADRLAAVVPGTGPLHPAGHHLRDSGLRAEVRRARHRRAGLDHGRRAAGRRRILVQPGAGLPSWPNRPNPSTRSKT